MRPSSLILALALGLPLAGPLLLAAPSRAQDFSTAIVVNDRAVTAWEVDQRERLLQVFGTPGDVAALARTQLVDDRLKQQEFERVGATFTDAEVEAATAAFVERAGLPLDQFLGVLAGAGVASETLRDYVTVNTLWRDYARARFAERITVTDAEIDQRLAQEAQGTGGFEVLLSEIIIAAPPPQAAQARAIAEGLADGATEAEFSAAAQAYSATPSREQGGRLDWAPITNYPEGIRGLLLGLAPGGTTPVLELDGAVAVIQLRGLREGAAREVAPEAIDYAQLRIPGGASAEALAEAARVAASVDRCDDLYGIARGLPADRLLRQEVSPGAIDEGTALDLAALDPDEATWGRTIDGGATLLFTMLCGRTYPLAEGIPDREAVRGLIQGERLTTYSDALLADLRAAATIVGE